MGNIKISYSKELLNDLQKYGNNIAKNIARQARDQLTAEYKYAVERFYDAYTPEQYERKYTLRDSCSPYYKDSHGTRFHGGVRIYADRMADVHNDSNYYILNNALEGIHGTPSIAVTPPWILEHVLKYRELLFASIDVDDGGIGSNAIAKAKSEKYSIMKFS